MGRSGRQVASSDVTGARATHADAGGGEPKICYFGVLFLPGCRKSAEILEWQALALSQMLSWGFHPFQPTVGRWCKQLSLQLFSSRGQPETSCIPAVEQQALYGASRGSWSANCLEGRFWHPTWYSGTQNDWRRTPDQLPAKWRQVFMPGNMIKLWEQWLKILLKESQGRSESVSFNLSKSCKVNGNSDTLIMSTKQLVIEFGMIWIKFLMIIWPSE